ncbi:MAG: hypothetical protein HY561_09980 [Gemmatimonadetes bacterium]|nr:hypothetical protein [Gemmatimonadota bacterium]
MKRLLLVLATAAAATGTGACGAGELVVQAQLAQQDDAEAAAVPLKDLEIRLFPFDRDQLFDSLAKAFDRPEPSVPDSLVRLQDEITRAQEEWQVAESRWNAVRDSLKQLVDQMKGLSRADAQYVLRFRAFQELEPQEQQSKSRMDAAFGRFTELQSRYNQASEEVRLRRAQWADEAFAPVDSVIAVRLEALDKQIHTDTTDAQGIARVPVDPGEWWVVSRYELPYQELYWNVRVDVGRGDPTQVPLTRENALVRPKL